MKLNLTTKSQIEKRPARTTAAMLLKMKITTSCPNNAKHNVASMCHLRCVLQVVQLSNRNL
jgi:hypothetical protein